jgi:toxin ParE1/3/4
VTYRVEWAPRVLQDVEEILEYVAARDSHEASERLASRILGRAASLASHHRRCRIVPELRNLGVNEYRELIFAPYRLFYTVRKGAVWVVGVLDGRRDLQEILISRYLSE